MQYNIFIHQFAIPSMPSPKGEQSDLGSSVDLTGCRQQRNPTLVGSPGAREESQRGVKLNILIKSEFMMDAVIIMESKEFNQKESVHFTDKQDKYSDIINLKIEESDKTSEAENNQVED